VKHFHGATLSWTWRDAVVELTLDYAPANEIGTAMLVDLEKFAAAIPSLAADTAACIITSARPSGFSAGGDLRELYEQAVGLPANRRAAGIRKFLTRIHHVANQIDAAPFVTIGAVHGICFGGGFELALTCDIMVADKMARFAFPELRLGFIPGFGGIPRLKRDASNSLVRDLLFTGRTINATRAHSCGIVSQLAGEGEALKIARSIAAQITKYDSAARKAAKQFIKPIPRRELKREIALFCRLFSRPETMVALKGFIERDRSRDPLAYLPPSA
jgi:enoyl-CoA hydratase/carnithine racemase